MNQRFPHPELGTRNFTLRSSTGTALLALAILWSPLPLRALFGATKAANDGIQVAVSFGPELSKTPLDGRLLVMLSTDPRTNRGSRSAKTPGPSRSSASTSTALRRDRKPSSTPRRWVIRSRAFARFRPANTEFRPCCISTRRSIAPIGHVVKLPMDRGEGQQWNKAPGNLYSTPRRSRSKPARIRRRRFAVRLDKVIPPIPDPPTTKYIKHERIQSERLTKFWGRPMHLGAHVLLPEGFDSHPEARYPLVIFHGHFPQTFGGFREEPPDPDLKPEYSERFHLAGLQPHRAGTRPPVLQGVDRARTIRGWSSSRSSTPTPITTTRTP